MPLGRSIEDPELFNSLLDQSSRYTSHSLRENFIEAALKDQDRNLKSASLEEMESLWQQAKTEV